MTYWNNNGTYEYEAKQHNDLVPDWCECPTLKGEIWRAATRIYHDYQNNGFGNCWISPASFLMTHVDLPNKVKAVLFMHAAGNVADFNYDDEMEAMLDTTVLALRRIDDKPNSVDMWKFKSDSNLEKKFWSECVEEDDFE